MPTPASFGSYTSKHLVETILTSKSALEGEPGVGKSRLFWEFTHSHHT
jgi:hypothetical protein